MQHERTRANIFDTGLCITIIIIIIPNQHPVPQSIRARNMQIKVCTVRTIYGPQRNPCSRIPDSEGELHKYHVYGRIKVSTSLETGGGSRFSYAHPMAVFRRPHGNAPRIVSAIKTNISIEYGFCLALVLGAAILHNLCNGIFTSLPLCINCVPTGCGWKTLPAPAGRQVFIALTRSHM